MRAHEANRETLEYFKRRMLRMPSRLYYDNAPQFAEYAMARDPAYFASCEMRCEAVSPQAAPSSCARVHRSRSVRSPPESLADRDALRQCGRVPREEPLYLRFLHGIHPGARTPYADVFGGVLHEDAAGVPYSDLSVGDADCADAIGGVGCAVEGPATQTVLGLGERRCTSGVAVDARGGRGEVAGHCPGPAGRG